MHRKGVLPLPNQARINAWGTLLDLVKRIEQRVLANQLKIPHVLVRVAEDAELDLDLVALGHEGGEPFYHS